MKRFTKRSVMAGVTGLKHQDVAGDLTPYGSRFFVSRRRPISTRAVVAEKTLAAMATMMALLGETQNPVVVEATVMTRPSRCRTWRRCCCESSSIVSRIARSLGLMDSTRWWSGETRRVHGMVEGRGAGSAGVSSRPGKTTAIIPSQRCVPTRCMRASIRRTTASRFQHGAPRRSRSTVPSFQPMLPCRQHRIHCRRSLSTGGGRAPNGSMENVIS